MSPSSCFPPSAADVDSQAEGGGVFGGGAAVWASS